MAQLLPRAPVELPSRPELNGERKPQQKNCGGLEGQARHTRHQAHADQKHRDRKHRGNRKPSLQTPEFLFRTRHRIYRRPIRTLHRPDAVPGLLHRRGNRARNGIVRQNRTNGCLPCRKVHLGVQHAFHALHRALHSEHARRTAHPLHRDVQRFRRHVISRLADGVNDSRYRCRGGVMGNQCRVRRQIHLRVRNAFQRSQLPLNARRARGATHARNR
ncbi:MAG: hypothetical protein BWY06_03331 [Candidatus Latescibacteria bacterium ADurb.Bin168]|nr:MAG: hypothetical protein BWY06_03331 [Candidatus Latescibacteria bacterium ADurb.Bin168]